MLQTYEALLQIVRKCLEAMFEKLPEVQRATVLVGEAGKID
ncbi:MAG: hypothetical protein R3C56_19100 [Pirellulaceae bacterium]